MGTAMQYHKKCIQGVLQSELHRGSVTINSTARECHNLKYYQGVSQSKVLPGTTTIKSNARDHHNQKFIQGVQ